MKQIDCTDCKFEDRSVSSDPCCKCYGQSEWVSKETEPKENRRVRGMDKKFANQECSNCKFRDLPVKKASPCWDCYTLKYGRLSNWVADEENKKMSIGDFKDFMKEFTELCDKYNITSVALINESGLSPRISFGLKSVGQEFTMQKMYRSVGIDCWRVVSARIEPRKIDIEFYQDKEEK